MTATLISPSGTVLHHRARLNTTPATQADAKPVRLRLRKIALPGQSRAALMQPRVQAWLDALRLSMPARDLVAVEMLCETGALDFLLEGDVDSALGEMARRWSARPGPDDAGWALFAARYRAAGGE